MNDLFLKLLNMSISASWLVLAVLVLRFFMKKTPKWIICLLWGIVALRLLLPFTLESSFSLIPSAEVIPTSAAASLSPAIQSGIPAINGAINPVLVRSPWDSFQSVLSVCGTVWAVGLLLMLVWSALSFLRLRRQVAASLPWGKDVFLCDDVVSPFLLGIFRPRIYLPSGLQEAQLTYILAHEYAHIRRRDHWWKPLGFLLLSVYWFNPLLWLAYVLLCRDIEQACDEKVIREMDTAHRKHYSETLVACSTHRRMILTCPVAFGEVGVKTRVKGVLSYKKPAFWIILASAAACVVTAACFLTNPEPCAHTYAGSITQPSTCAETGVTTYTCALCQHSYTEPVALLAHDFQPGQVVKVSSCTKTGTQEYICADCNAVTHVSLPLAAHTPGVRTLQLEANCTEPGVLYSRCTVCQENLILEVLEPNEIHDLHLTSYVAATCTAPGEGSFACSRCDYTETCAYEQRPHNYVKCDLLTPPTCVKGATYFYTCVDCGFVQLFYVGSPNGKHQWIPLGWVYQCGLCGVTKK